MKHIYLKSVIAGAAMLLSTTAATAAIPEHLYMVGPASPSLWVLDVAQEMTNEGEGVFSYRGNLYKGQLQFINEKNWDTGIRYVPEADGSWLTNAMDATIIGEVNSNRFWYIPEFATWEVKAFFADEGNSVMFTAQRIDDLSPMVVPMGGASGQWDSAFPNPACNIYPQEGTTDVFVWEGTMPAGERNQLKFIAYPTNWWEAEFYLPESVDEGKSYKTVKTGVKYPVKKGTNANGDNLDHYWSFAVEDCAPYRKYRATLNLTDMTIEFAGGEETYVPEQLYMVGTASPSLWNIEECQEMVNEGNGVFSYHGNLYNGELQFVDARDWGIAIRYVPEASGWHIVDAQTATVIQEINSDRKWWVPEYGNWDVEVRFTDEGRSVSVTAERAGDMLPQAIGLGHAISQWDCQWPTPSAYLQPKEDAENVFVWEGTLTPDLDGSGQDLRRHIKFIAYPKAWDQGCIFYVPESVDHNGNVKTVQVGDKLPLQQTTNGNGPLDWFWGFPAEECTPDKTYRITLNLNDNTVEFTDANGDPTGISDAAADGMKAAFIGDNLVVEGAASAIAVYDIAGRRVAYSTNGELTVAGLPKGVYVVQCARNAVKVIK